MAFDGSLQDATLMLRGSGHKRIDVNRGASMKTAGSNQEQNGNTAQHGQDSPRIRWSETEEGACANAPVDRALALNAVGQVLVLYLDCSDPQRGFTETSSPP